MGENYTKNQKRKLRALHRNGGVCSKCARTFSVYLDGPKPTCCPDADWLMPDDPQWMKVVQANRRIPTPVPDPVVRKRPEFDLDAWVEQVRQSLSLRGFDPERLVHVGRSKELSTKAGRRKCDEHRKFVITPPIEAPFTAEDKTVHLWHGTSLDVAADILVNGFRPSRSGMLGPGVYMGKVSKARNYARSWQYNYGLMLKVEACMGRVTEDQHDLTADTIYCPAGSNKRAWGGYIRRAEWCVRDPLRVVVRELHVMKKV